MTRAIANPANALRILVVDQDRPAAETLADGIATTLPVRPDLVLTTSGRAGADALRAGSFDIAAFDLQSLSDLGAPEDGIAKLVKLAGPAALTVALDEGGSVSVALAAMRSGAHDMIQKPIDGAAFVGRVATLAQRHGKDWVLTSAGHPEATEMASMLTNAGAALRAAAEAPSRPPVLPMWQQEQRIIEDAIATFAGNITLAAQALELNPSTIYRKRQAWAEMDNASKGAA